MVYKIRSRPGLRGHPCRFMPRALVCTRDKLAGSGLIVWLGGPPLQDVPEKFGNNCMYKVAVATGSVEGSCLCSYVGISIYFLDRYRSP